MISQKFKHDVLVINGPNLNLLGKRNNAIYGSSNLEEINNECIECAKDLCIGVDFFQSNHEGEIVTRIQNVLLDANYSGLIINAGAYSHTSIAILDALELLRDSQIITIEVHISNIYSRKEIFRNKSIISSVVDGVICGLGKAGYLTALRAIAQILGNKNSN